MDRYLAAACLTLMWVLICVWAWRTHRIGIAKEAGTAGADAYEKPDIAVTTVVAYASQTGMAQELAADTAQSLRSAGIPVALLPLHRIDAEWLAQARRMLLVVSTTGEGDPPDSAATFVSTVMSAGAQPLLHLDYALLALGDREYRHYCRFGRTLDKWLRHHGARPLFDRIDVDNSSPGALDQWRLALADSLGLSGLSSLSTTAYQRWQLVRRSLLNPGNAEAPCFHLELKPVEGAMPVWQAGDIAEVILPSVTDDAPVRRQYSIASLPADEALHLLVRQVRRENGQLGMVSGALTAGLEPGSTISLRIRSNQNFHPPEAKRGMILIGNGTGLAGLRAHMKARIRDGADVNWLLYGERTRAHDYFYRDEIEEWLDNGSLRRLDLAFSRDQSERVYVQHRLLDEASCVRGWVEEGAAIYVCGSLSGMSEGVHDALNTILGPDALRVLAHEGRYRRDVY